MNTFSLLIDTKKCSQKGITTVRTAHFDHSYIGLSRITNASLKTQNTLVNCFQLLLLYLNLSFPVVYQVQQLF